MHAQQGVRKKLVIATVLALIFMIGEIIGGTLAGSLAIVTDAGHLMTDVAGFIAAIIASILADRPASAKLSYGLIRAEVLSALANICVIVLLALFLIYEGVIRIHNWAVGKAAPIDGKLMMIIAFVGVVVNVVLMFVFGHDHGHDHGHTHDGNHHHHGHAHRRCHHHQDESAQAQHSVDIGAAHGHATHSTGIIRNINLEAAHLHVVSDLLQSLGVAAAGLIIYFKPHWGIVDPVITIVFSLLILVSTYKMFIKATHVLLEGVPDSINPETIRHELSQLPGVVDVHDLHIWMLSVGRPIATVHLKAVHPQQAMRQAYKIFASAGVDHVTVQTQEDGCLRIECTHPCPSILCAAPEGCGHPESA